MKKAPKNPVAEVQAAVAARPRPTEEPPALQALVAKQKQQAADAQARREEKQVADKERIEHAEENSTVRDIRDCQGCNQPFESLACVIQGKEICRKLFCETCISVRESEESEQRAQEAAERRRKAAEERWVKLCPPRYAEPFDIGKAVASIKQEREHAWRREAKLSGAQPRKWAQADEDEVRDTIAKVQGWPYGDRGVGLVGVSGHSKTRLMFTLIFRYLNEGRRCEYINLAVFGREIAAKFSQGAVEANDWIKKLCKVDVLFFDDVGKEKMTERVETEFYGIVEVRSANLLPIYFTANSHGDRLMEKMTNEDTGEMSDRALPIVRRLRQYNEGIVI